MTAKTVAEKILSTKSGRDVRAGDVVVCDVDLILGTDASSPMTIDYFEQMGGESVKDPSRLLFSLDHYSPPTTEKTRGFHALMQRFVAKFGGTILEVGEGIGFQVAVERGLALPGDLVIGADSHTVTCGAINALAVGVGSSDLAAAMLTGQVWLRAPETIRMRLVGTLPSGVGPKDAALALVADVGPEGANYRAVEFDGPALGQLTVEDRLVFSNLAVEMGAKAATFPVDGMTAAYLATRTERRGIPVHADGGAKYWREIELDLSSLSPQVALPHAPNNVVPISESAGIPIQMVFIGTCTGGRVTDLHEALDVLRRGGGRLAPGVQLVVTPASREVERRLHDDGTLDALAKMGATVTTPGCGACCGTSGVIPADGTNVLSTANRNFKGRMGPASVSIYLASPAACAASALAGRVVDPRGAGR